MKGAGAHSKNSALKKIDKNAVSYIGIALMNLNACTVIIKQGKSRRLPLQIGLNRYLEMVLIAERRRK
ncbi:MAG: hypothetical protein V8T22_01735 [Oscillospiraceae bacterium]